MNEMHPSKINKLIRRCDDKNNTIGRTLHLIEAQWAVYDNDDPSTY